MADDLDAFFEEVSAAEADAVEQKEPIEDKEKEVEPPPAKKAKTSNEQKPVRPVGVVVAAAASASSKQSPKSAPATTMTVETIGVASLPPGSSSTTTNGGITTTLPPLPTTIPPPPPGPPPAASASNTTNTTKKAPVRTAAGKTWVDETLNEWPENDYRIFVGNLSPEVTDQQLYNHFAQYPSIAKAKVVRNKEGASKGYGFVSLLKPLECAKAIREKDQSWLGSRPIRTKRSDWQERNYKVAKKKQKKKGYLKY